MGEQDPNERVCVSLLGGANAVRVFRFTFSFMEETFMSRALTTATAPILDAAATAISACAHASAPNVTTSLSPPTPPPAPAPDDLEPPDLSPAQILYLRALGCGLSITAAADEAGVSRKTAYRWQANPRFAQTLFAWRRLAVDSARHKLLAMTEQAMEVVSTSLQKSDVRVAMALLKGTGLLSPKTHEYPPAPAPSAT